METGMSAVQHLFNLFIFVLFSFIYILLLLLMTGEIGMKDISNNSVSSIYREQNILEYHIYIYRLHGKHFRSVCTSLTF